MNRNILTTTNRKIKSKDDDAPIIFTDTVLIRSTGR